MTLIAVIALCLGTQTSAQPLIARDFSWVSQPWTANGDAYYKISLDNRAKAKLETSEYNAYMETIKGQYYKALQDPIAAYSYCEVACLNRWGGIENSPVVNETPDAVETILAGIDSPHVAEWDYLRYLNFSDIQCTPKGHKFLVQIGDRLLEYYKDPSAIRHWVVMKNQIIHLGFSDSKESQDAAVDYGRQMASQKPNYKSNLALALENRFLKFKDAADGREAIGILEAMAKEAKSPDARDAVQHRIDRINEESRNPGG